LSRFFNRFLIYFPVVLILLLILNIYISYTITYLLPLLDSKDFLLQMPISFQSIDYNFAQGITLLVIFNWNFLFLVIALLRTIFMDPGYLRNPLDFEYKLILQNIDKSTIFSNPNLNNYEISDECEKLINHCNIKHYKLSRLDFLSSFDSKIDNGPINEKEHFIACEKIYNYIPFHILNSRNDDTEKIKNPNQEDIFIHFKGTNLMKTLLCSSCLRWKPERSHHCRVCGKCVLKMDHHCPWLANCIGFRNYKYFCLIHFYGLIACSIYLFTYWEKIYLDNKTVGNNIFYCIYTAFSYVSGISLFFFTSWLFLVNSKLLLTNLTVIEQSDKERFPSNKVNNIYDLGIFQNFISVFGSNWLLWFFPFNANYNTEGIVFETNDSVKDENPNAMISKFT